MALRYLSGIGRGKERDAYWSSAAGKEGITHPTRLRGRKSSRNGRVSVGDGVGAFPVSGCFRPERAVYA